MIGELLEAERVHSIVAAFFTVFNYFGGGGKVGLLLHFGAHPKFYRYVDSVKAERDDA